MGSGFTTQATDPDTFGAVLRDAVDALESRFPFLVFGSLASTAYGESWPSGDVDLLVRRVDAESVLRALSAAGFQTERTEPNWIYKATKHGVLVDVIFQLMGGIRLDREMLEHARSFRLGRTEIPLMAAEDQLVVDACGTKRENPGHWFSALSVLAAGSIDWSYLSQRARLAPKRVLALLSYAQSDDVLVPDVVLKQVFENIYGGEFRSTIMMGLGSADPSLTGKSVG